MIKSVKIYGRENIYEKSLNHAEVLVSDGGQFHTSRLCASFEYITNVNVIETYYCEPDAIGRYVWLINKDNPLRVCEMQVFGHFKWDFLSNHLIINEKKTAWVIIKLTQFQIIDSVNVWNKWIIPKKISLSFVDLILTCSTPNEMMHF